MSDFFNDMAKRYSQLREDSLRKDLKKQENKILDRFIKKSGITSKQIEECPETMAGIYESDDFTKAMDGLYGSDKYARLFQKKQNITEARADMRPKTAINNNDSYGAESPQTGVKSSEIEAAKKAGYVQGVCECVAAVGTDYALGKKLLTEMNVTKKLAKEYASPETFRALESGVFAQKQEQKLEHQQKRGHRR